MSCPDEECLSGTQTHHQGQSNCLTIVLKLLYKEELVLKLTLRSAWADAFRCSQCYSWLSSFTFSTCEQNIWESDGAIYGVLPGSKTYQQDQEDRQGQSDLQKEYNAYWICN